MSKVVLALDQASKITGWSVFIGNKLETFGKFTANNTDLDKRLVEIRNKVENLIEEYSPDEVVFEDIQQQDDVGNNVQTFKILAEVYGVISELLTELQIPHSSILASSWKSTLGIEGRTRPEQKKNTQKYIQDKYKITVTQDEADAIGIGEAYLNNACAW